MKKKTKVIVVVITAVFLAVWSLTWGIVVNTGSTYYPEGVSKDGKITVFYDIDTNRKDYGIPYLFTYHTDSLPYDINLQVMTENLEFHSFQITSIEIKYSDHTGSTHLVTRSEMAVKNFKNYMKFNHKYDSKSGTARTWDSPMARVDFSFKDRIKRDASGTLKIEGFLFYNDDRSTPVYIEKELTIRKSFEIMPVSLLSRMGT
jgi:hypothetical protein